MAAAPDPATDNSETLGKALCTLQLKMKVLKLHFLVVCLLCLHRTGRFFYDSSPQCLKRRLRSFMELPICWAPQIINTQFCSMKQQSLSSILYCCSKSPIAISAGKRKHQFSLTSGTGNFSAFWKKKGGYVAPQSHLHILINERFEMCIDNLQNTLLPARLTMCKKAINAKV